MTVINKSVFCRNLDGARLLGHPVYIHIYTLYIAPVRVFMKRIKIITATVLVKGALKACQ